MFSVACGGGDDDKGIAITTQVPSRAVTPEVRTPIGVPPVQPTQPSVQPVVGGEPTAFQTADGAVTIRGNLFSAAGPKRRVLIIASQLPDTEAAWQPFARELAGAGIATLTFQMPQYRDLGGQRDYALMDKDLESAVLLLESRDYPLIYVLGDNTAGIAALKLAARRKVAGVVTVATPPTIAGAGGYDARPDVPKVTAPKLFIVFQDGASVQQELVAAAADPKQAISFSGPAAVIRLLNSQSPDGVAFKQAIRDFLLK